MATKLLTKSGEAFIRNVGTYFTINNLSLLNGNNGKMARSNEDKGKNWVASITNKYTNKPVTNNSEFVEYLIGTNTTNYKGLFNEYAEREFVDANVIAAQSFAESEYRVWVYPKISLNSTASSLSQFLMGTIYDLGFARGWLTSSEQDLLTAGMIEPDRNSSWIGVKTDESNSDDFTQRQNHNHDILHQNLMNNPQLSIKLQCKFMSWIGERNANLASSSLFAYSRGASRESSNYVELISQVSRANSDTFADEGLNYVQEIFSYLGDKNNNIIISNRVKDYTKGFSFGYDKELKLDENFSAFNANADSGLPTKSTTSPLVLVPELRNAYDYARNKYLTANPGYDVVLTSVYRTPSYQNQLFRDGCTPVDGFTRKSCHNYLETRAFDYGIFDDTGTYLDGRGDPTTRPAYQEFAEYAREVLPNIVWGGGFTNISNDVVHLQI